MRIAIITGGSKGLGQALYAIFKDNNYYTIDFSRTGSSETSITCDFANYEDASRIVDEQLGQLSKKECSEVVLINNVGTINPIGPISHFSPEKYQHSVNTNFLASIMVTGIFTRYFQAKACKKTIIYISSGAAVRAKSGWSLYCGAKAGLEQFFKAYDLEQAMEKYPINAVTCNPGVIDTGMQETIRSVPKDLFPEIARFINLKNNNELQSPEAVAKLIFDRCLNTSEKYIAV